VDLWEPRVAEQEITCKGGATMSLQKAYTIATFQRAHTRGLRRHRSIEKVYMAMIWLLELSV
jgi:hypothetical protein